MSTPKETQKLKYSKPEVVVPDPSKLTFDHYKKTARSNVESLESNQLKNDKIKKLKKFQAHQKLSMSSFDPNYSSLHAYNKEKKEMNQESNPIRLISLKGDEELRDQAFRKPNQGEDGQVEIKINPKIEAHLDFERLPGHRFIEL